MLSVLSSLYLFLLDLQCSIAMWKGGKLALNGRCCDAIHRALFIGCLACGTVMQRCIPDWYVGSWQNSVAADLLQATAGLYARVC